MIYRKILVALLILVIIFGLVGVPAPTDDIEGVILTTIKSTVTNHDSRIIVSTKYIGPYQNMSTNNASIVFIEKSEIQEIADREGPTNYHEFKEIKYAWFGYKVAIDHMIMYPSDSPRVCYSCYGDLGFLRYRDGEWVYENRGGWIS